MASAKFRYNPERCAYEPVFLTGKQLFRRLMIFMATSFLFGAGGVVYYNYHYQSLDELRLLQKNEKLMWEWDILSQRIEETSIRLSALEVADDDHYRVVLDMPSLDSTIRHGGTGGHNAYGSVPYEKVPLILESYARLKNIDHREEIEIQSLEEIEKELDVKEEMMVTRPAMQPIDNRQLVRFNAIYGLRLHPIYGDWRVHNGLDLTAGAGTPVYATGNGVVTLAHYNGGYGNVVFVNHGFGFESRYAHLSGFNTQAGRFVKRGDIIGFVGSTGVSTNPHLHYEVLYRNRWVNPINFMYRDLAQSEYNKLINQSN